MVRGNSREPPALARGEIRTTNTSAYVRIIDTLFIQILSSGHEPPADFPVQIALEIEMMG
jgi:hypothetical protein